MSTDFYAWCKTPCNRYVHMGQRYSNCKVYFGFRADDEERRKNLGDWIMDHFYGHAVLIVNIDEIDESAIQDLNEEKSAGGKNDTM